MFIRSLSQKTTVLVLLGLLIIASCSSSNKVIPIGALEHFQRGNQYQRTLDYRDAIKEYLMAIREDPDQKPFHYNLGIAYYSLQLYENAILSYQKALELDPDFADAWYNLSLSLNKTDELEDAFQAYERYQNLLKVNTKVN